MLVQGYLVISRGGSVRFVKGTPGLDWDEISLKVSVTVPEELFKRPALQADIIIPKEAGVTSPISVEVIDNMRDAIRQATNLELNIKTVAEEPSEES